MSEEKSRSRRLAAALGLCLAIAGIRHTEPEAIQRASLHCRSDTLRLAAEGQRDNVQISYSNRQSYPRIPQHCRG
jgi:hypothetical protein